MWQIYRNKFTVWKDQKTGDWKVMAFKLKVNEQGHAVVVDGKPIYVDDEGKELPFCANET